MSTKPIEALIQQDPTLKVLNERLAGLRAKAEIEIVDQASILKAAEAKVELESYIRSVENHFEPELGPLEERVKKLKLEMAALLQPAKQWLTGLINRKRMFDSEEKRRAEQERQREQAKIDAAVRIQAELERKEAERIAREDRERREKDLEAQRKAGEIGKREEARLKKQAEEEEAKQRVLAARQAEETAANAPTVEVKPNIPSVAGFKNQTYYHAEVQDAQAIIRAYETAKDPVRIAFLRRFITINVQEIGRFARETKDNEKATGLLPGVKFTSKG